MGGRLPRESEHPLSLEYQCVLYPITQRKRVLKQYAWCTIATNGALFSKGHSFFLNNHVCLKKSAPKQKGTPLSEGYQNSTPRATKLRTAHWAWLQL